MVRVIFHIYTDNGHDITGLMWLAGLKGQTNWRVFLIIQLTVLCYVYMNMISLTMKERGANVTNTNSIKQ